MSALHVAIVLAALAFGSPAMAQGWEPYRNETVGFAIELPTGQFRVDAESEGRLELSEIDGTAQLDVFGVENPDALSVDEFRAMMEEADPSRRITYRAGGESWFVLSGYIEGEAVPTIFYAKFMLNPAGTALSAFEISYPRAEKEAFDPVVERLEDSLTAPEQG